MHLSSETPVMCQLELEGCESPLIFNCSIIDTKNADLKIFMSTLHKEPNEKNNMKLVDRKKYFKFYALNRKPKFGENDMLFLTMYSVMGCTIQIKASKNEQIEEDEDSDELPSRFSKKNKLIDNYFKARALEQEYEEKQRIADEEELEKKRKRFSE